MPVLSQRRIQLMLDELTPKLEPKKRADLVSRIINKRTEQALPAELELTALWALSKLDNISVEPDFWPTTSRPDGFCPALFGPEGTGVEIAAFADGSMSQEDAMRSVTDKLAHAANRVQRGAGSRLFVTFHTQHYREGGRLRVRRLVEDGFKVSPFVFGRVQGWLQSDVAQSTPLEFREGGTRVTLSLRPRAHSRQHNFFCSMPSGAYDANDNALADVLNGKRRQLRRAVTGRDPHKRVVILLDAGGQVLRRLYQADRLSGKVSGADVIEAFLQREGNVVDAVVVCSPWIQRGAFGSTSGRDRGWDVHLFEQVPGTAPASLTGMIEGALPPPMFEGYQVRSLHAQGAFNARGRGWYLGTQVRGNLKMGTMEIHTSLRALHEFLAGRLTHEQFLGQLGMGQAGSLSNLFEKELKEGRVIESLQIVGHGPDEDDDEVVIRFRSDASAAGVK